MDDSPLSIDGDPAAPTQDGGAALVGSEGTAGPNAAADQLGALLSRTIEPLAMGMEQRFAQQEQRMNQIADAVARAQAPAAPKQGEGREAEIERFVADPTAYRAEIAKQVQEQTMRAIAPYLLGPANNTQQTTLASERSSIDSEFGDGAYDKLVKPHIDSALQHMPEAARYNPDALRTAVAALVGSSHLRGQLAQQREAHQRKLAEAAKQRPKVPNILGPSRAVDAGGKPIITPEDRVVLDALENQGFKFEESELKTIRGFAKGTSLDDMHAAMTAKVA